MIPEFHSRDDADVPRAWVARVRNSRGTLTPLYSANRSVRAYVDTCYVPGATAFAARAQDASALGHNIARWNQSITQGWEPLRIGRIDVTHNDDTCEFTAEVTLASLVPEAIRVELYADAQQDGPDLHLDMKRVTDPVDCEGRTLYLGSASANRASTDYAIRIIAVHAGISVPLGCDKILWQS